MYVVCTIIMIVVVVDNRCSIQTNTSNLIPVRAHHPMHRGVGKYGTWTECFPMGHFERMGEAIDLGKYWRRRMPNGSSLGLGDVAAS